MDLHSALSLRVGATLLLTAAAASAQFAPAVHVPVGPQPDSVAAGDWDNDGDQDLAVPVDAPDRVVFLFNDGAGGFGGATSVATGSNTGPHTVVAVNVDGDADVDVAVTLHNSNQVRVLLNNGSGVFSLGSVTAVGLEPRALRAGNLNGGAPDLVAVNRDGNSVSVLLNNGSGSFATTTLATGIEPRDVAIADLNGDGDMDLAISVHDSRQIELKANNGMGAFSPAGSVSLGTQLRPEGIAAGDLDDDQDIDLVAAASGNGQNVVARYVNNGGGTGAGSFLGPFNAQIDGTDPSGIVLVDADVDGDFDVATSNTGSANVTVVFNDGDGNLSTPISYAAQVNPEFLAAADLDGNAATDLVTANEGSNSVSVLMNLNAPDPFINLGGGVPGISGIPLLQATGSLQPNTTLEISLTDAAPNALGILFVGANSLAMPFKGGTLFPDDDLLFVFITSGLGEFTAAGTFPGGSPSGTFIFLQAAVSDPAAVKGVALSDGLQGTTP